MSGPEVRVLDTARLKEGLYFTIHWRRGCGHWGRTGGFVHRATKCWSHGGGPSVWVLRFQSGIGTGWELGFVETSLDASPVLGC